MSLIKIADAQRLMQERSIDAVAKTRNHKIADSYMQVAASECKDSYEKGVTASMLNNFAQIMDSELGTKFTTTHAGDFGPYVMEVWPLVTAWYPDFPLKDLISVQSMEKPLAYLMFSLLKAGTTKGDTTSMDVVETPLGKRTIKGRYPTGEVFGEQIATNQFEANAESSATSAKSVLAYAPLNVAVTPGYLEKTQVKIGSAKYTAYNVVNGKVLFKDVSGSEKTEAELSIDVATGVIEGSLFISSGSVTSDTVKVNYVWDLDYADTDNIQKVKEQVDMRAVEAVPRAIALEWTVFSEYLKKSQFGIDIREDNTKRILNLLYQMQVRYILDEMYEYRDQSPAAVPETLSTTISINSGTGMALEVISQNVQRQLKVVGGQILKNSGRMEGNKLVVGLDFKNWLESLPSNFFTPKVNDDAFMLSPHEIGTYGTYQVFYDPELGNNEYWMTYRGKEWYDAAYYLGEYMPIVPTDCIALAVTVRTSFLSMEAYRYDKKNCVIAGEVSFS